MMDNASACLSGSESTMVIWVTGGLSARICVMETSLDWQLESWPGLGMVMPSSLSAARQNACSWSIGVT
jgi:hypothetical protein